ncbi:MAG: glycosyltransferase [Chloroflexi bacterium]|nr:glycosyltransferase [Chloroflexota bacterium]
MSAIVAFVLNDVRHDSRVLREAATLSGAGHPVTIVGRTVDPYARSPERTATAAGGSLVRVPVARGWLRWLLLARRPARLPAALTAAATADPLRFAAGAVVALLLAVPAVVAAVPMVLGAVAVRTIPPLGAAWRGISWRLAWQFAVLPWARAAAGAAREAAPAATIFWAHDLRALPAAIAARDAAGGGSIVYDAHEIFPEAGGHATRPAWARRRMAGLERELAARAAALVTVNEALADRLGPALGFRDVVIARNCPPRWTPAAGDGARTDSPLRTTAGVPDGAPILLYHGGLAPGRGIDALAAAIREPGLERSHLVFMGGGPLAGLARELAAASGGRIHVLPPVAPDVLLDWVAGADVVVAPIQPTTLNHRLSSPNKVFEGIAAGVPVVGSDLPGIRSVILADPGAPLGGVTDPDDPAALARSIRSILELPPAEGAALRARCLAAAHERWNWETESAGLVALAENLGREASTPEAAPGAPGTAGADPVPQAVCFVLASSGEFDSRTRRFATDLAARGHRVTIVARVAEGLPAREAPGPGIDLLRVETGRRSGADTRGGAARHSGPLRLLSEARRILRVIAEVRAQDRAVRDLGIQADLVHAMGFLAYPVAAGLARTMGARLVYDARDLYVESNNIARLPGPLRTLFAWREGTWARRAARVLTVNEECADHLERRYRIRRPVIVMNGQAPWDPPKPRPDRIRERLGIQRARRIALYHGGLMPDRGVDRLIRAAERPGLETTELVIMGTGAMEARLREQAAASPALDRIHFLPPVPPAELLEWVASADVGVMPNQPTNLNERLSTPNKLLECLAAGTPVVSSDFPGRRRIIDGGPDGPLGRVCDPTNPESIAAAILEIANLGPEDAAAIRERCRRAARDRYGWPVQLARAIEAYGEVTGRPW